VGEAITSVGGRLSLPSSRKGVQVNPQTIARVTGVLFIITIIASIPAFFILYAPVLGDPNYIVGAGAGADTGVSLGALLEFITCIANIGTAVVLFPIVRRQNEVLALGYVTSRVFESAIIMVGVFSLLTVVSLRSGQDPALPLEDFAGTAGADAACSSPSASRWSRCMTGRSCLVPASLLASGTGCCWVT
jgi:hypothetical protein